MVLASLVIDVSVALTCIFTQERKLPTCGLGCNVPCGSYCCDQILLVMRGGGEGGQQMICVCEFREVCVPPTRALCVPSVIFSSISTSHAAKYRLTSMAVTWVLWMLKWFPMKILCIRVSVKV